jgi:hypothetical protein
LELEASGAPVPHRQLTEPQPLAQVVVVAVAMLPVLLVVLAVAAQELTPALQPPVPRTRVVVVAVKDKTVSGPLVAAV